MEFVHLHVHSHYSLLDGLSKIPDLVAAAKRQGAGALALTDHGAMYGTIEFYEECKKAKIKPIIGCEIYITEGDLEERAVAHGKKNYYHLVLLVKNHQGYLNLMKITTKAHVDGYYYRPRIDHDFLKAHSQGLICLSACLRGELPSAIIDGDITKARRIIEWHREVFGDDYYLEMQHHPNLPDQIKVNQQLKELARELGLPLVVSSDSHYLSAADAEAHEALLCVQTGAKLSDKNRFSMKGEVYDLTDPKTIIEAFADVPEAVANTQKIADMCEVEIELDKIILPDFDVPPGESHKSYLKKLVEEGIGNRFGGSPSSEVKDRVKHELSIIHQMNYESYFLVVADFVKWAKHQGIVVGPGRGSGAASIVSYALGITDINPLEYDLIFERFLNPARISMPDFDIDFADDRRDEVIRYVVDKYGKDRVAQIVTFGTMAARASVRDTGRALDLSYSEVDRIAKLVPFGSSLKEALATVDELQELYNNDPKIKGLIDLAQKLEGVVRHTSVHAAGVVMADKDLTYYTPLQQASKGEISQVTQYAMGPIERLGLLKIDFLGLKNLTIIKNTLRIVRKTREQELDIAAIPMDDKATFQLLGRGETDGVFQFESEGMKRNLQDLQPTVFRDLIAMVALYRPGPMELISDFIDRKHGRKSIAYLHPQLEPILKETYGIAVYQEQVLQIARDLCGFSLGEADILRKAIGKKIRSLLLEQKKKFVEGGVKSGVDKKIARQLFEFVQPFARYGFNKAHATSYALIAYQTAYLKSHFPNEFLAAVLTSDQGDLDKVAKYIAEAERLGIKVLPPSVNESFTDFAVVKETGNIRFGLNVIKNVGRKVSDLIVEARVAPGTFESLVDFLEKVPKEALNRKVLEALSRAGALDEFGDRKELFENVDTMIEFVNLSHTSKDDSQLGIFGEEFSSALSLQLRSAQPSTEPERLAWERELLGTFVSKHPLKDITPRLKGVTREIGSLHEDMDGKQVRIGGIVAAVQRVNTKNGEPMLFVRFEDLTGSSEIIVFPKLLQTANDLFRADNILVIEGKVNVKDRVREEAGEMIIRSEVKIIAESVIQVDENYWQRLADEAGAAIGPSSTRQTVGVSSDGGHFRYYSDNLVIRLPQSFNQDRLQSLKQILEKYHGDIRVELEVFAKGKWQKLRTKTRVTRTRDLEHELTTALS